MSAEGVSFVSDPGDLKLAENRSVDLTFTADGHFNAVVFWFTLELYSGVTLSTGPEAVAAGPLEAVHHHRARTCLPITGQRLVYK
jgi:hypothetical protein